jgi:amidase
MSVFSLDVAQGNPVTTSTVDKLCAKLGVSIEEKEKEDYRRLLAIFHDASTQLMAMDGEHVLSLPDKSDTRVR